MRVVPLADGPNHVDLNGDGKPDLVWRAWRDNGNAHGFDVLTFYVSNPTPEYYDGRPWLLVPLYDSTHALEQDFYRTFQGADCVLEDVFLIRSKSDSQAPALLVRATRDFGETFGDTMPVTFVVYRLVTDSMGLGSPYSFRAIRTIHSRRRFCDVGEAFEKELGLVYSRSAK